MNINFELKGGLNEKNILDIYDCACELLEKMGMEATNTEMLKYLENIDGFKIKDNHIKIKRSEIERCVRYQYKNTKQDTKKTYELQILSGYPIYIEEHI